MTWQRNLPATYLSIYLSIYEHLFLVLKTQVGTASGMPHPSLYMLFGVLVVTAHLNQGKLRVRGGKPQYTECPDPD